LINLYWTSCNVSLNITLASELNDTTYYTRFKLFISYVTGYQISIFHKSFYIHNRDLLPDICVELIEIIAVLFLNCSCTFVQLYIILAFPCTNPCYPVLIAWKGLFEERLHLLRSRSVTKVMCVPFKLFL